MPLRVTHAAAFGLIQGSLQMRLAELIHAQQQTATGKRILKPSDDPIGASLAIDLHGEKTAIDRWRDTAAASGTFLDATSSALSSAQDLLGQARALAVQGLSGTLDGSDRAGIANQLEAIKASLFDVANTNLDGKYLFGGTVSAARPYVRGSDGTVSYRGNGETESVQLGPGVEVSINRPGSEVFGSQAPRGLALSGLSGLAVGSAPSQGRGWVTVDVRHDATTGTLGSGFALASGGASDTILGDRSLVVDATAHTVQLGNGPVVNFPAATDADASDFVVRDEHGAVVHLDVTGYTGVGSTSTLTGTGSIRAGSGDYVPLDTSVASIQLEDPTSGAVLSLDPRNVVRASQDVARFEGTVDAFDSIDGIIADLRNSSLSADEVQKRMDGRLSELIRNQDAVLSSMGLVGASITRLQATDARLSDQSLDVGNRLSGIEDIDPSEAILAMTRAQQSLELAQMTASRVLQTTLLDYLR